MRSVPWTTLRSSASGCTLRAVPRRYRRLRWAREAARLPWPTPASTWEDMQFAFGGSYEVDNPDAVVNFLGLTGLPFTDVYNGCATAASALDAGRQHDPARRVRARHGRRHGQAPARRLHRRSGPVRRCRWYGEMGLFLTTKFFAMKINRYMHDYGIARQTLARVAAKNYRNGALNPNAFRRQAAVSEEEILESRDGQLSADAVHVLPPGRGCGGRGLVPGRCGPPVHRPRRSTCGRR